MNRNITIVALASFLLAACGPKTADIIVYGDVRTCDGNLPDAEALAIRNGRFIYVGDREGADKYLRDGRTRVIDHKEGLVIPSFFESHAHYFVAFASDYYGFQIDYDTDNVASTLEKVKENYALARAEGRNCVFGNGWNMITFQNEGEPDVKELDAVCPDIPLLLVNSEGHSALANSACMKKAGIIDDEGRVLRDSIRGGRIEFDAEGRPTGLFHEQAATYLRLHGIDFNELLTDQIAAEVLERTADTLHALGITSYMDGWSNYFGTDVFPRVARRLDKEGRLGMNLGVSYEIESSTDNLEAEIEQAFSWRKYRTGHVHPDYVKLFMDGTVEGGTGFVFDAYPDGHKVGANWEQDEVAAITGRVNGSGRTMHIHTMGDAAVNRAVNAFEQAGSREARNTIVHVYNMLPEDYGRCADNGVVAVTSMIWHVLADDEAPFVYPFVPKETIRDMYPMKSFFDNGVVATAHTDFPATAGSPIDPFWIMEISVTGLCGPMDANVPFNPHELLTREQALQAFTINGAWQMHLEKERGSITEGKYADFLLVDRNFLECPVDSIHCTEVLSTWFEGRQVR